MLVGRDTGAAVLQRAVKELRAMETYKKTKNSLSIMPVYVQQQ